MCSSAARWNLVVAYILCSIHYFLETSLFYSILNGVLVFKLSVVHCCTRATISIQGQLYRYSYHQISVTIHRRIEHSTIKNTKIKHVYSVAQVYVILWQNYLVPIFVSYRSPSNQIKSNHFYCHITTAQVPWWVKFLRACSKQCKNKNSLHIDSTYLQTVQKTMCKIHVHILNIHSVL